MAALDDKLDLLASAPEDFVKSLKKADEQLALEIIKIYTDFVVGRNLELNPEALAALDDAIIAAVRSTDYKLAVDAFIPNFDAVQALNTEIHELTNGIDIRDVITESNKIANHQAAVEAQLRGLPSINARITETVNGRQVTRFVPLENDSLDKLVKPISDLIRQDVILGVSFDSATTSMLEAITEGNLGLEQWASQIARDALSQADGIQQEAIKEEFNLTLSRYVGTIVDHTRPLCHHILTSKEDPVYTDEEMEAILNEYAPGGTPSETRITYSPNGNTRTAKKGAGIIPGTDIDNFTVRRGGYNCHHSYIPIVEA